MQKALRTRGMFGRKPLPVITSSEINIQQGVGPERINEMVAELASSRQNGPQTSNANHIKLPGIIPGFGGGTFDMDGTQVTPPGHGATLGDLAKPAPANFGMFGGRPARTLGQQENGVAFPDAHNGLTEPKEKPSFFGKNGLGRHIAGTLGDAIAQHMGNQPQYLPMLRQHQAMQAQLEARQQKWAREDQQRLQSRNWALEDEASKRNALQYFMSNGDRVQYDPVSGESSVLYDGQEPFEDYAQGLGLEPGTPEYTAAMQDYVLKGSGPTAFGFDVELDNVRTNNDIRRKGSPTFRQRNPSPRRSRRTTSPRRSASRPTAKNASGQRIEWNGSAWVPSR